MNLKKILTILCLLISVCQVVKAQAGDYNHPELRWKTVDSEHFIFHYHNGTEKSTNRFINVAEDVYANITTLYKNEPKQKIHVIINDYDDYANGGAYYYNNKISLWAPALETELRGSHNWFRNVFTHEFAHMIQLDLAKKLPDNFPGMYLQWTGYEKEKRKDVLTGYPNIISSYNIPMHIIPSWFAEGAAQNQDFGQSNYDFWDALRDMNFRERVLDDKALSYDKLSDFGNKTAHEAETVYNTGMKFTRYLTDKFGVEIMEKVSREMSGLFSFSFERALEKVTGFPTEDLYNNFIEAQKVAYKQQLSTIEANPVKSTDISDSGYYNTHPKISPDGRYVAYLSTKDNGESTFYRRGLYIRDLKTDSVKMVFPSTGVASFSWYPDSRTLFYSRVENFGVYGNQFNDLFLYDLDNKREEQITVGKRASNPAVSPDGRWTAFVVNKDGSQNLYMMDNDSSRMFPLTKKTDGSVYIHPAWNNKGDLLAVDYTADDYGRNIQIVDKTGALKKELDFAYDVRQPCFSDDDKYLYYSSDKTGIFNIYRRNLESDTEEMLTNVRGGAFYPHVQGDSLVYSEYTGIKIRLKMIIKPQAINPGVAFYKDYQIPKLRDIVQKDYLTSPRKYGNDFEHIFFVPRISFDNNEFKPGAYFFLNDYLEKISLMGGFNINMKKDYDLFGLTEFRFLLPTIYGMAVNIVKHNENEFLDETKIIGYTQNPDSLLSPIFKTNSIDYTFNLKEINIGLKAPVTYIPKIGDYPLGKLDVDLYTAISNYKASADYGDNTIINYTYYKNQSLNFKLNLTIPSMGMHAAINPTNGRLISFQYGRHFSDFITGFDLNSDYGTLKEVYEKNEFSKYDFKWLEHYAVPELVSEKIPALKKIGFSSAFRGSYLSKKEIDSFYNDYIGGLSGLKGYSFYSLGGTRTLFGSLSMRIPLVDRVDWRGGMWNFKKAYLGFFADAGVAWTGKEEEDGADVKKYIRDNYKTDIGANLRLYAVSFYNFPTAIEYSVAYGLNRFTLKDVEYGKELRHYFTLLFDFQSFI